MSFSLKGNEKSVHKKYGIYFSLWGNVCQSRQWGTKKASRNSGSFPSVLKTMTLFTRQTTQLNRLKRYANI